MLFAIAVLAAVTIGACYFVWRHVRPHVLAGSEYQVSAKKVRITPPPEWVRVDVTSQVLRDLAREGPLSLLDEDLTVRLAAAFAAHPWIARVERVSKQFPSGIEVVVEYRVPVAMVEVEDGRAVLPVDVHGVVLPTRDDAGQAAFTSEEAERFPRIAEIHTMPAGPVGTRWGDAGVAGGAQIAAAIGKDWTTLGLARIIPWERKPAQTGVEYTFVLETHSGSRVFWGRAPGTEVPGEVSAAAKLAQLRRYAAQNGGTLDGPDGPRQIEIDSHGALLQRARPVVTPLPASDPPGQRKPEVRAP